jgi:hypothetical protein
VAVDNDDSLFKEVEATWAPPDHPVFQLTSPTFEQLVSDIYQSKGSPTVTAESFWQIYLDMKTGFDDLADDVLAALTTDFHTAERVFEEKVDLEYKDAPENNEEVEMRLYDEDPQPAVAVYTDSSDDSDGDEAELDI